MDVLLYAAGGVAAAGALTGLLFVRAREKRLERTMRAQRALYDRDVVYRPVEESEKNLSAMLDAPRAENAELTSQLQRLQDIVLVSRDQALTVLLRPYVDDFAVAYIAVQPTKEGTFTSVYVESYSPDEILTTMPGSRDVVALPPQCKRSYTKQRVSLEQLLRHHRSFTARDRDTSRFLLPTNANEVAAALQQSHDEILAWRRSMPPDELIERDLQVWLGRGYERGRSRWKKLLAA